MSGTGQPDDNLLIHTPSIPPSYESNQFTQAQDRIAALERQVASLLEAQLIQQRQSSMIIDPPIFEGKNWFFEWQWKMNAKLRELEPLDEATKIDYIVSRMTGKAIMDVSAYLPPRGKDERARGYRTITTAEELMQVCKKAFS